MREPTAIKLFVGQVPRDWSESDLRTIFEPFGEIHSLNLLQDKASGQHKGCAFLTYFENDAAKAAQEELHEKRTLPGARNPIQVKPASSETMEDNRKLFVGMISRSSDESDLKDMFSEFGTIEDVTILKNPTDGQSKGCAFIKFETRLQAQNAIKTMHNSQTMEGCRAPIVVKIADTEKDKITKRKIHQVAGAGVLPAFGGMPLVQPAGFAGGVAGLAQQVAYYQQVFAQMGLPQLIAAAPGGQQLATSQTTATARSTAGYGASAGGYSTPGYTSAASMAGTAGDSTIQQAYSGMQQYMATSLPSPYTTMTQNGGQQFTNTKKEGPEGANLFIYQVPQEFNDSDLMQTFMPFGSVVSAKVFIDKVTGLSKGFGFVSYDNAASANAAISAMNGFAIGSKRLKVQLKRPKDQSKPY